MTALELYIAFLPVSWAAFGFCRARSTEPISTCGEITYSLCNLRSTEEDHDDLLRDRALAIPAIGRKIRKSLPGPSMRRFRNRRSEPSAMARPDLISGLPTVIFAAPLASLSRAMRDGLKTNSDERTGACWMKSQLLTLLLLLCCVVGRAQATTPLPIGGMVPGFCLTGTDGVVHCANDWKESSVLVVAFLCNHCTESQLYEGRLNKLTLDYASKGVRLVAIQSSNPQAFSDQDLALSDVGESLADMKVRAAFRGFRFPYLFDGDSGATAKAFGAIVAPSIYVFDKERKLRYEGRIDDNPTDGLSTEHEAAAAIDALLAGNPVAVPITTARGCPLRFGANTPGSKTDDDGPVSVSMASPEILSSLRHNPTGKLLLVNFYATWCGPCVSEFPDLMAINRLYRGRGLSMTTVSSNTPEERSEVLKFLQKMHATTNNLLYGSDDTYAMQAAFDPDVGSAVPVTVLIGPDGKLLLDEQGEIDLLEIRRGILANLPDEAGHEGSQKYWSTKRSDSSSISTQHSAN